VVAQAEAVARGALTDALLQALAPTVLDDRLRIRDVRLAAMRNRKAGRSAGTSRETNLSLEVHSIETKRLIL
jgi:hypothetical protein